MKKIKNKIDNNIELIKKIADQCGLTHDGGDDTRLFYDNDNITVFASDMTKKEYKEMEKKINSFLIKGAGFKVYCWNDCSGYEYWSEIHNNSNYISITANITNAKKVNIEKLKSAIQKAHDVMRCFDNRDYHDFNKKDEE